MPAEPTFDTVNVVGEERQDFDYLAGKGERKALCIACVYPGTNLTLPGTEPDQFAMVKMLTKNGYSVTYLSDNDPSKKPSTRANIVGEMKALIAWANEKPGRQVWCSFSGHGTQTVDKTGEEEDGMDEAMVPSDYATAGLLKDDELKEIFTALRKESHCMIFMDCCHSGTILDLPYCLEATLSGPDYPPDDNVGTIYCVSAAKDDECAYETAEGGVCTRAFIGSYKPNQTPGQILDNMRDYAAKKKMPQTIKMHSNKEFKEGDASWMDAPVSEGACSALLNCLLGENSAKRSIDIEREIATGKKPPPKPTMPYPPASYLTAMKKANGYITPAL